MKKLAIALALMAALISGLWMTVSRAGVGCALPFNLTNGTTADATQVMANYNALVTCLGNAAQAGSNNDITSINGLTTPLSYAQGGSSVYIASSTSNVGNAYTITTAVPNGFTLTKGFTISFIPPAGNTSGGTTLNVNSSGVTNLFRQTPSGAVSAVGGELVTNQVAVAQYDGTQFECIVCSVSSQNAPGFVQDYAGLLANIPAGWHLTDGSAISRTTFSALFATQVVTSSATMNGSTTISMTNAINLIQVGWYVGGANITCNTFVTSVSTNSFVVNGGGVTGSGTNNINISPYQLGDCSTTFNLPNYAGKVLAGVDGSTNITATTCPNAASIGDKIAAPNTGCGGQSYTIITANLPPYTPAGTVNLTNNTNAGTSSATASSPGGITVPISLATIGATFNGTAQGGTSTPFSTVQPTSLVYKIIKL